MKAKTTMAFFALFLLASTAGMATAQEETKTTHKKTRTLSGCLKKGDEAKEYRPTTAKGATSEIRSDNVSLGEHVGHTVRVTGVVSHANARDEGRRQGRGQRARSRQGLDRARAHDGDRFEHGSRKLPRVTVVIGASVY